MNKSDAESQDDTCACFIFAPSSKSSLATRTDSSTVETPEIKMKQKQQQKKSHGSICRSENYTKITPTTLQSLSKNAFIPSYLLPKVRQVTKVAQHDEKSLVRPHHPQRVPSVLLSCSDKSMFVATSWKLQVTDVSPKCKPKSDAYVSILYKKECVGSGENKVILIILKIIQEHIYTKHSSKFQ